MYKIIGADGKEYGPVGAEDLRQWIHEGRANAQSRVRLETETEWRPLGVLPEFAVALAAPPISATRPIAPAPIVIPHPTARKTNGMAIAGFVCSLLGIPCCGLFGVMGLVFSIIALSQIKRDPQLGGRSFAVAGIAISIVGLLVTVVFVILFFVGFFQNTGQSLFNQ